MNKKLKDLLVEFLRKEIIVKSWGVSDIKIGEMDVSFHVSAFKYKGRVQVVCLEDSYCLKLKNTEVKGVELDDIVEIIDDKVETTNDYFEVVVQWIATITK